MRILENIHGHDDLVQLTSDEQKLLCQELRTFLVSSVAQTGGHLASNLGVVELSLALETVFDTRHDRLVFDVGHQSYVHKILTGRRAQFSSLRRFGGIAGFPKPSESDTDAFVAGHASSSVSVALGMARARTQLHEDRQIIALIGDGATTGGLSYEGLNDAGASGERLIVVLNDNEMSIAKNVGGMAQHLSKLRMKPGYFGIKKAYRSFLNKIPGGKCIYRVTKGVKDWIKGRFLDSTMFEDMGFTYIGPIDGHDLPRLIELLKVARSMNGPVLFHVTTKKGCGYRPAEEDPSRFHGISPFDPETGKPLSSAAPSFSAAFGETMVRLGAEEPRLCAITAAMPTGTGLTGFQKAYPDRTYDVGIAEGHAVSMAGGLAKAGMIPVVAIYSTFLQRAYDMILQDVAMLGLHVIFAVDRAGLVGDDGETHHGVFDVGFLRQIPGITILCPSSRKELQEMLSWAVKDCTGPVAIRYPRGGDGQYQTADHKTLIRPGKDITLVTYGTLIEQVNEAAHILSGRGIEAEVLRLRTIKPIDMATVAASVRKTGRLLVVEEAGPVGSVGGAIIDALAEQGIDGVFATRNIGDGFVTHGSVQELYHMLGLDAQSIAQNVQEVITHEK